MFVEMKTNGRYLILKIFFIIVLMENIVCVRINRLQVPEVTQSDDPVILDCDYSLDKEDYSNVKDRLLVVKWYFNEANTPVYQWIPTKRPQERGVLKGRLNLNYTVSEDEHSSHRALYIIRPGPDLSGNYTCVVSTIINEDRRTKRMLVLVPGKSLELKPEYLGDGMLQLICYAEGVFPRPNMVLLINNSEVNGSKVSIQERAGLYDIKAVVEIPALTSADEFSCELHIPQANFTVRKEAIYYPANHGISHKFTFLLFMVSILSFVLFSLG